MDLFTYSKYTPRNCVKTCFILGGLWSQIVGLTASIGVEKATTVSEAAESVLGIMGNLDVIKISTVKENLEELRNTVPKPEEGKVTGRQQWKM